MIAPEKILAALQYEDWKLDEIARLRRQVAELERALSLRDCLISIQEGASIVEATR